MAKKNISKKVAPKPAKAPKVEEKIEESPADDNEIQIASSDDSESDSESDVELSEDSGSEDDDQVDQKDNDSDVEIKGLEDSNRHVIIKPSHKIDTTKTKGKRGVIYLGRIPEGFEENEMQQYFKQFGTVTRTKLSRNKKTGKSKHYGFIEFENSQVAKVAAEAMNNYLLYGHLLKCYVVENPSELIFSQSKFKVIPWKSISKHRNDKPKSQAHWEKLNKKYNLSQEKRSSDLKLKGIDLSYLN